MNNVPSGTIICDMRISCPRLPTTVHLPNFGREKLSNDLLGFEIN